ncbi:hypothetical protein ACFE04_021092 [Oxalis oulophora]
MEASFVNQLHNCLDLGSKSSGQVQNLTFFLLFQMRLGFIFGAFLYHIADKVCMHFTYLNIGLLRCVYGAYAITTSKRSATLKSDLKVAPALNKQVKSLDDDNWMFEGPRSRIHLISRPARPANGMFMKAELLHSFRGYSDIV